VISFPGFFLTPTPPPRWDPFGTGLRRNKFLSPFFGRKKMTPFWVPWDPPQSGGGDTPDPTGPKWTRPRVLNQSLLSSWHQQETPVPPSPLGGPIPRVCTVWLSARRDTGPAFPRGPVAVGGGGRSFVGFMVRGGRSPWKTFPDNIAQYRMISPVLSDR